MIGILGKKIGMTRIFQEDGKDTPVTVIECQPNTVVRIKTNDKDGYSAVQVGAFEKKRPTKTKQYAITREFKIEDEATHKSGDKIDLSILEEVKSVKITSTSKGKGFQGTIKRYNFARGPETHGSHHHREPGSVGACASPGRIHKGKKMPGRMGGEQTSLRTKIAYIDSKNNIVAIKGAIPGPNGSVIRIEIIK